MLKWLAGVGALVVPGVALAAAMSPGGLPVLSTAPPWVLPAIAAAAIVPYALRSELAMTAVLAAVLAAAATHLAGGAGAALGFRDPPRFDLTRVPLDASTRGVAEVRGYLMRDVSVAEYGEVEAGRVADQNRPPDARLMLMLPVAEGVVEAPPTVVVVRMPRSSTSSRRDGADVVTGRLSAAPRELTATLLAAASLTVSDPDAALLLDAGAAAEVAASRRTLPLALLMVLGAVALIAWRGDREATEAGGTSPPRSDAGADRAA